MPEVTTVPPWLAGLRAGLSDPAAGERIVASRPGRNGRVAAVLALIAGTPEGTDRSVLLVERAHTLRHHPGQLAFPGGAADPGDPSLAATALRESREEIGLDPAGVLIMGRLPASHVAVSGFDVNAVVGWWHTPSPVWAAEPREVAQVLVVPLERLTDPAHRVSVRHPLGYVGPAFWIDDPADGDPLLLWGLTAHLLDGVLELAGWNRPWEVTRQVEIPPRFLSDRMGSGRTDDH